MLNAINTYLCVFILCFHKLHICETGVQKILLSRLRNDVKRLCILLYCSEFTHDVKTLSEYCTVTTQLHRETVGQ